MFEKYWSEVNQFHEEKQSMKKEMVSIRLDQNIMFNKNIFYQNIHNIDNMDDSELHKFISYYFTNILINVFNGNEVNEHVKAFTNKRFLETFIHIVMEKRYLNPEEIIRINSICYDYLSLNENFKDPEIVNRMLRLSTEINRFEIPRLLGLGLSNNLSTMLSLARHSHFDIQVCVKRIDFIIITQPKVLMTQKMIEEIIKILYDTNNEFHRVFMYIMFDTIPDVTNEYDQQSWVTEEISEVNSVLNLAILEILENLTSKMMRTTLIEFAEASNILGKKPRFSLRRLSDDYYRINDMIDKLSYEDINVP